MAFDDLVLLPETAARRILGTRPLAFSVLAPLGAFAGSGALRVLRVRESESRIELVCGYESYVRLA